MAVLVHASIIHRRAKAASTISLSLICQVLLLVVIAARAGAEGPHQLPTPIAAADVLSYAEKLVLSPHQLTAASRMHAAYLERFEKQVGSQLPEFERRAAEAFAHGADDRNAFARLMRAVFAERERLLRQIDRLDAEYFESLAPILADEQFQRLPRIIDRRARQIFRGEVMLQKQPPSSAVVDLSSLIERMSASELEVDEAFDADSLDAIVREYERELTRYCKLLYDETSHLYATVAAEFADLPPPPEDAPGQPSPLEQLWVDETASAHRLIRRMSELNERTCTSLEHAAMPLLASSLHHRHIRLRYPDARVHRMLTLMEGWPDAINFIDEAQREPAAAVIDQFRRLSQKLVAETVAELDDLMEVTPPGAIGPTIDERLEAILLEVEAIEKQLQASLVQAIGPELSQQLLQAQQRFAAAMPMPQQTDHADLLALTHVRPDLIQLASPWSQEQFDHLLSKLPDELHEPLRMHYHQYADAFAQQAEPAEAFGDLQAAILALEHLEEVFWARLRESASEDAILDAIETHHTQRRLALARQVLFLTPQTRRHLVSNEWAIDLATLLSAMDPSIPMAAELIDDYQSMLIGKLSARQNAAIELVEALSRRASADETVAEAQERAAVIEQRRKGLHAANQTLVDLNRATLKNLAAALPATDASAFRQAYRRHAYPGVYDDPDSLHEVFAAVMARKVDPDLAAHLAGLRAEYVQQYERHSRRMIKLLEPVAAWSIGVWFEVQPKTQRHASLSRVLSERRNLNARTALQVQQALPPELAKLVPAPCQDDVRFLSP